MHDLSFVQSALYDAHFKDQSLIAETLIIPNDLTAAQRLNIYRNNTFITLSDALSHTFSVVHKLVGDDFFFYMAAQFLKEYPPKPGPLFEYGEKFSYFIDHFEPATSVPYLSDVARLEWVWNIAYHAAEATPIKISELAEISQDRLATAYFKLHPSCQFVTSQYSIYEIWLNNQSGAEEFEFDLDHGVNLLIMRPTDVVNIHVLDASASCFLTSLNMGSNVEQSYVSATSIDQKFDLTQTIITLFSTGVFVEINLASSL